MPISANFAPQLQQAVAPLAARNVLVSVDAPGMPTGYRWPRQQLPQRFIQQQQCETRKRVRSCEDASLHQPCSSQFQPDQLYQHCLQQAEQLVDGRNLPVASGPLLPAPAFGDIGASNECSLNFHLGDLTSTPPWALRTNSSHTVHGGAPRPLQRAAVYPAISKLDHLQLASPYKRRRCSYDCYSYAPEFPASTCVTSGVAAPAGVVPQRPSGEFVHGLANRYSYLDSCNAQFPETKVIHTSPCEPFGQLITSSASGSSNILEALRRWAGALHVHGNAPVSLAFHIWSRVAGFAVQGKTRHPVGSVAAACLWIALKLQEHRLVVPSATSISKIARVIPRDLRRAELAVMEWVDWAPLSQWCRA